MPLRGGGETESQGSDVACGEALKGPQQSSPGHRPGSLCNERLEPDSMPGRIEQLEKTVQDRRARWPDGRSTAKVVPGSPAGRSACAAWSATWPLPACAGTSCKVASGERRMASELWPLPACAGTSWKSVPVDSAFSLPAGTQCRLAPRRGRACRLTHSATALDIQQPCLALPGRHACVRCYREWPSAV